MVGSVAHAPLAPDSGWASVSPASELKSNGDYVVTASCASGSISYETTGSPKTTIVFIWTKTP